jgi:hypothetical protein
LNCGAVYDGDVTMFWQTGPPDTHRTCTSSSSSLHLHLRCGPSLHACRAYLHLAVNKPLSPPQIHTFDNVAGHRDSALQLSDGVALSEIMHQMSVR